MNEHGAMTTEHQEWEAQWWQGGINTYQEESKQIDYAREMGLIHDPNDPYGRYPVYDMGGKSVLDIGGGPVSLLLKCKNLASAMVVDPTAYPPWVGTRYGYARITYMRRPAEQFDAGRTFDEVWIMNVLQHTHEPEEVVKTALRHATTTIRIFDWIGTPPTIGHPHTLHKADLDKWFERTGAVKWMDRFNTLAYIGVFEYP